uniref:Uncharacterized protein n=1 Tax=Anguilla anguilla TaxID=7936 RepID=A0A0E9WYF7_ANGAN
MLTRTYKCTYRGIHRYFTRSAIQSVIGNELRCAAVRTGSHGTGLCTQQPRLNSGLKGGQAPVLSSRKKAQELAPQRP